MVKITGLPAIDALAIDGSELVPVVKNGEMGGASLNDLMAPALAEVEGWADMVATTVDTTRRWFLAGSQVAVAAVYAGMQVQSALSIAGERRTFDSQRVTATALARDGYTIGVERRWFAAAGRQVVAAQVTTDASLLSGTFLDGKFFPPTAAVSATSTVIVCGGDSLTAGAGSNGNPYPSQLAGLTGLNTVNLGVGGQTSRHIAGRLGAVAYGLTIDSSSLTGGAVNKIVAGANAVTAFCGNPLVPGAILAGTGVTSGTFIVAGPGHGREGAYQIWPSQTVSTATTMTLSGDTGTTITATINGTTMTVTTVSGTPVRTMAAYPYSTNQLLSTASDNTTRTATGYLGSVHGTLTRTATGGPPSTAEVYTFTPDAGATLPAYCPPNTPFVPDYAYDNQIHILWIGRNNYSEPARVLADIAACVARLKHGKFVVMPVLNGEYAVEYVGAVNYGYFTGIEAALANLYPANYLPIRRLLIDSALSALGLTATTQDTTDIGHDIVPAQLRADNVHLTATAYGFVASQVKAFLTAKGWI